MRVGFEVSSLGSNHRYRGLGFYTKRLLESFPHQPKSLEIVKFTGNPPRDLDLIHYPAFTLFTPPPPLILPTVATVHDLIPLKFPQAYPLGIKGRYFWWLQQRWLKQLKAIITDSYASKNDLVNIAGLNPDKIFVIYLAADKIFKPKKTRVFKSLPKKFVLYVGDLNWNKNIINLVNICLRQNLVLVVVGKQAIETNYDHKHIENQPLVEFQRLALIYPKQIICLGYLTSEKLVEIYNRATIYCQPSFAEGFGLPILEAMACGCPVITSNNTSLAEISGNAAKLIDPTNLSELQSALLDLWQNPTKRQQLIKAGYRQAAKFSWFKTAKETIKLYEKIV